jgi:hypothetical protein
VPKKQLMPSEVAVAAAHKAYPRGSLPGRQRMSSKDMHCLAAMFQDMMRRQVRGKVSV